MNFLIIGGLLAFALLAVLVAVLLGMREQRAEKARANGNGSVPTNAQKPAQETPTTSNYTAAPEKSIPAPVDEQALVMLNGQFHEFATEIRSLHQQAWNLEQRLRGLTEMVDHIEESRNRRVHVEEETLTGSDESA